MIRLDRKKHTVPPKRGKYPWDQMKKGSSFFVAVEDFREECSLRAGASIQAKKRNWKITVRKTDGGVRVWRLK